MNQKETQVLKIIFTCYNKRFSLVKIMKIKILTSKSYLQNKSKPRPLKM